MNQYITLNNGNINKEHICCAISDKKHQVGVVEKKQWIKNELANGHTFTKLNVNGKVFIEYTNIEKAWASVIGKNYFYIHCLWVSGSYKNKGYGKALIEKTIEHAKNQNKDGICIISSLKKKPFLSDYKFLKKYNFEIVDQIDDYLLLAYKITNNNIPQFSYSAKNNNIINEKGLRIYYSPQCPYIINCIKEVEAFCKNNNIKLNLIKITTLEEAKNVPSVFNNYSVFLNGEFVSVHLLNENYLKKLLNIN